MADHIPTSGGDGHLNERSLRYTDVSWLTTLERGPAKRFSYFFTVYSTIFTTVWQYGCYCWSWLTCSMRAYFVWTVKLTRNCYYNTYSAFNRFLVISFSIIFESLHRFQKGQEAFFRKYFETPAFQLWQIMTARYERPGEPLNIYNLLSLRCQLCVRTKISDQIIYISFKRFWTKYQKSWNCTNTYLFYCFQKNALKTRKPKMKKDKYKVKIIWSCSFIV